jgi:Fic-DOC domain mobile mystery protein B
MTMDPTGAAERWDGYEPDGVTPLTDEERAGLIPSWIATRTDLNEAEQDNITAAMLFLRRRSLRVSEILDEMFVRELHRLMFTDVWKWAGSYRRSERNIGIDWTQISVAIRTLMDDAAHWASPDSPTLMAEDEAAARLHHRLVFIHPFPNGNGRHARAMADLLLSARGAKPFSWGSASLAPAGGVRDRYIQSLRAADRSDFHPLLAFVRS